MVFIAHPPKTIFKPKLKPKTGPFKKGPVLKKYINASKFGSKFGKTKTVKKWTFNKQVTKVGKNGTCGRVELDYNMNPHTSVGVYGDGCIGNPLSSNPIPTTVSGGGVSLDFHF